MSAAISPAVAALPDRRAIEQAAAWFAQLASGIATEEDTRRWQRWLVADPMHAAAWARIEAMQRSLAAVPGRVAAPAFKAAMKVESRTRRAMLRGALLVAGSGTLGWWGWQQPQRQAWMADLRTGTGEQRNVTLADGSLLAMNTQTAVDVHFDTTQRRLDLRTGEILVQAALDAVDAGHAARPFSVHTAHGWVRSLGARFLVYTSAALTRVTVLEAAVEIHSLADDAVRVLEAGQQIVLNVQGLAAQAPAAPAPDAWRQGSFIADALPLQQLLLELGRYRRGYLACDPAIAALPVSGAFPVRDTDRALAVLAAGLPVRIETMTRYWVRVVPR